MEQKISEEERYTRAVLKMKQVKGFYTHLLVYCVIIPFLIFINVNNDPSFTWYWFPVLGWGIGLFMHGLHVFGKTSKWEQRKIREYMNDENF